ncbi:MAG TPA: tetratricopeptide repeat protein [Pirellulales bacterium]|nr:tetratricopeptide repeat protein [Pirellulales bacterium]
MALEAAVNPTPATSKVRDRLQVLGVVALLVGLSVCAYWGVWDFAFVNFDDGLYVADTPQVKGGLTAGNFSWAWSTLRGANWHPLTWISLQLDASLFGPAPRGFHITNLLLHACNSVLLFLLCRHFWNSIWPGLLVASLFAVHPQHVESVAWISERKDVLSTLFGMLALVSYCRYASRPSAGWYLAVTIAFLMSLLAKPMLVTLPCLMLVFDWWPLRRRAPATGAQSPSESLAWKMFEKVPWFAMSVALCVVTIVGQRAGGALRSVSDFGLVYRVSNAIAGYLFYLGKTIWPTDLIVFYPPPTSYPPVDTIVRAAILLAITALVVVLRRSRPHLLFGWLWFLGTLVPVIGLIQIGQQAYADRYNYFPVVGLLIMFAGEAFEMSRRHAVARVAVGTLACAAAAVCFGLTQRQCVVWRDSKSLWERTLEVSPTNFCAHRFMADLLVDEGRLDEAVEHSQAAAAAWPVRNLYVHLAQTLTQAERYDDAIQAYEHAVQREPADADSHYMLGTLLLKRGHPSEAATHFEESLAWSGGWGDGYNGLGHAQAQAGEHEPALKSFAAAVDAEPRNAVFHNDLAVQLARMGDTTGSLAEIAQALEIDHHYAEAFNNRGNVLASLERWPDAALAYGEAVGEAGQVAEYRVNLAMALAERGEVERARRQYGAAAALEPDWQVRAREKAWQLATATAAAQRDGATALRLARQVRHADEPPSPAALDAIGAAYAELGRFDDAVRAAEQAIEYANRDGAAQLAAEIEQRLELYRQGKPFRSE